MDVDKILKFKRLIFDFLKELKSVYLVLYILKCIYFNYCFKIENI